MNQVTLPNLVSYPGRASDLERTSVPWDIHEVNNQRRKIVFKFLIQRNGNTTVF